MAETQRRSLNTATGDHPTTYGPYALHVLYAETET